MKISLGKWEKFCRLVYDLVLVYRIIYSIYED